MDEKKIKDLLELGASRATAISALKAAKWDINEAAVLMWDDKHANATDEGDLPPVASTSKAKSQPKPIEIPSDDEAEADAEDDYDFSGGEEDGVGGDELFQNEDDVAEVGADPFAQISFQKDRKMTVIEVEETPDRTTITVEGRAEDVSIMPQGEWMKGCPEGTEQSFLFQVYNRLTEKTCPCPFDKCPGVIKRSKSDFFVVPHDFRTFTKHLQTSVQKRCPTCKRTVCLACSEEVQSTSSKARSDGEVPDCLLHCPDLQAVILGIGLSMVESKYYGTVATISPSGSFNHRPNKKTKLNTPVSMDVDDDDDDGYGAPGGPSRRAPAGTGYGGARSGHDDQSAQDAARKAQLQRDSQIADLLSSVRAFLPNRERKGPFRSSDHMPSIATAIHLRRRFNPIASELLRNDSLSDMSERRGLYSEFLTWLEIFAAHEVLSSIMGQAIMRVSSIQYLAPKSRAGSTASSRASSVAGRREKEITFEGSAGPRELLEGILRQVNAAKRSMSGQQRDGYTKMEGVELTYYQSLRSKESEEVAKLESFCDRFVSAVKSIDTSLRNNNNAGVLKALQGPSISEDGADDLSGLSLEALQKRYVQWAEKARYDYYDFEVAPSAAQLAAAEASKSSEGTSSWQPGPSYKHAYSKEIQAVYSYPKRNTAIAREHSTLSSSLPVAWDSSVFIRVDESRPDVMKALITGPEGTPYSNGCFIFDIFLGSSYNQKAPTVKTMTTKNGKYRLNPNLYADGKVCLSLLGTWSGPGWIAGKSSLLQVIISIQSMILCDEPYLNEPGWATMGGSPQSRAYDLNVRRMVVDDAMIDSLKSPNEAFADIIRNHFRFKSKVIRKQLDQWLADDDGQRLNMDNAGGAVGPSVVGKGSDSQMKRNVTEMKRLLSELEQGVWPLT